jgi:mannan endo-1,4-beta-mannosidase
MNAVTRCLLSALAVVCLSTAASAQNDLRHFLTRSGDRLMEGDKEYRFVSFNIPNLHLVEDNMAFDATNEWRFPDEYEITDALTSVKLMGGRAVRVYVVSVCRADGPNAIPCHVVNPGEFNEEAFRALDRVLEVANRVGVRVIIPLVDNWKWWGGAEQYAGHRGKPAEAFWTDRAIVDDFKRTVSFVLNRRNTYTGTLYKDDKAVFAWETGNELLSPYSWTKEIAAHIKSLDANHLVWDGYYIGNREILPEALDDPNIDIVSSHHYPSANMAPGTMASDISRFRREIAGRKVYVVGEFGFVPVAEMRKVLDTVIREGISGAMTWSLRFHNRDGGFYWHSEPSGGGLYKAFHHPGFPSGDAYEETALIDLVRTKAFEIRGMAAPPLSPPATPRLLPIESVARISWQGAAGATGYDVERAERRDGPWTVVGMNVDDTDVQYRPLFADAYAAQGAAYYYRVVARNAAGASAPSNVVGPVRVADQFTVDELVDHSKLFARYGGLSLESANARPYKEDAHRLKGGPGSWIMYRTRDPLSSAEILAFFEQEERHFEFYASSDGKRFARVEPTVERLEYGANPYGYKLPVRYRLDSFAPNARFVKIVFGADAQIGRVEVRHGRGRAR